VAGFFMIDFKIIDAVINDFISNKQFMAVSKDAKSDWFKFKYRRLEWISNGLNNLIEICPNLESGDSYVDWNLSCISSYVKDNKRFYHRIVLLKNVTFKTLQVSLKQKLSETFVEINSLEKKDLTEFIELNCIS
jgi:hypothetical protein